MNQNLYWIPVSPGKEDLYSESIGYNSHDDYIFVFDIDKTLYKMSNEFAEAEISTWVKVYNKLKGDRTYIPSFEEILSSDKLYGGGFFKIFNITYKDAEELRGNFPFHLYLKENKTLNALLGNISYKKWCFTNGVKCKAERILNILNITEIDGVICSPDGGKGDVGKPYEHAFIFVEKVLNVKDKSKVIFFDDSKHNILMGQQKGWTCYLVREDDDIVDVIQQALEDIKARK